MIREELLELIDRAADEGWTELDLSGKGLTELPAEIGKLTKLETLILGKWDEERLEEARNQLTNLPNEIAQLSNLTSFNLSYNQITQIPHAIFHLTKLTTLSLSHNQVREIPDAIARLFNLTRLNLGGNQIIEIPNAIAQLSNLTVLSLSSNEITEIPDAIAQLTNLTEVDLSNSQITEISEAVTKLSNLTKLRIAGNEIAEIPDAIAQLTNLTSLDLSRNQITEIPDAIAKLSNLTVLALPHNKITKIPEAVAKLSNLTSLGLWRNQITEIPDAIGQLSKLVDLYLSSNQITAIPNAIAKLTHLTDLDLSNNQIAEVPEAIAQLSCLDWFSFSSNQITEISGAITQMTNLTELDLSSNQITEIPDAIAQLTKLERLELDDNQIREIPNAIARLINLTELHLSSNQITEIPDALAQLTDLEELDLESNQIKVLPEWVEHLPNLKKLDLRCNPLPITPEILGSPNLREDPGSVEDIFNYCRQLRSGKVRPLNEAKLLLVGQGSVGKTSLIERLLHDRYNPRQPQTDGLSVKTWNIHINSKDIRLNVWDFGGQEIYHATHQFFLTKRSLYLLVCDCRISEDQNRIEYWLKLIKSFGDQSPVIIVGNKKDEQPLDINRKALRDKYPNIKAILETSCETNDGIDALRSAITQEIAQLREVYNLLPLSWFEVKQHLEALDQDCISYPKYACICEAQAIDSEVDQQQLIGLLHNLGLVLNFRDHPILQNTNVLKPDWVTQGIYALLSDETLKTVTKGILTPADLSRILDSDRYPPNRHPYLTELMQEFQLCFPISAHTYLIPGLLPKEEPADTDLEGDTLDFQYHYRILPESIISRFIVLTHDKIHQDTYWRSGVMLAHTEGSEISNIARIKADPEDKKIFISISGRETTRRSFLFLIRDTFQKIHRSFANPDISEWVPVPGHPDHPPLDYQELLGLEEMGDRTVTIGKLKLRVDLRQLLDGYESIEARQWRRMGDRGEAFEQHFHHYGDVIQGDKVGNDKVGSDKIGRDKIGRDKIGRE